MKIDLAINVSKAFGELVSFFSISNRKLRWNLHTLFKNCFHLTNCRSCNYLRWKKNIVNCKQSRYCSFIFHTSSQLNKQSIKWKRISHDSTRIWNDASTSSCKRVNIDWLLIHRWKITLESSSVNIDLQVPTSRVIFLCSDIIYCNKLASHRWLLQCQLKCPCKTCNAKVPRASARLFWQMQPVRTIFFCSMQLTVNCNTKNTIRQ